MSKLTKKQKANAGKVDANKLYAVADALALVKECATAKFDESIEVAVQLGIDAKKSDQVVRGAVVLPNGTGKTKRVAVFAQGAKADEARAAGADVVGMDDLAAQVKAGDMPFDVVIAAPDAMRVVGTLGQILGPRGLMPNPKVGTVTADVATAVKNAKAGQVQFRVDKAGIVHGAIGLRSFDVEKLQGNLAALVDALVKAGNMPFDVVIAAPDAMRVVGTLGQILGPRGLMPNPKVGTVTPDVATAVKNAKAGQVQFRVDKAGIVHATIGRRSFDADKLQGNLAALVEALNKSKPPSSKGVFLRKLAVSSTMGVGVRVDTQTLIA